MIGSLPKDIAGNRYGRLVAVDRREISANKDYFWNCVCDCGNFVKVTIGKLNFGYTKSCGCLVAVRKVKHGMTKTKEYKSWTKMRDRCLNINDEEYPNYGGRGIKIQKPWDTDFKSFIEYIGKHIKDGKKYTIDRIDNSKGYEEGNVRWATQHEQARNKTMLSVNSSGKTGVTWDNKRHPNGREETLYCNAVWSALNGKQTKKCFSTKKFGILPAFCMACEYRDKMIAYLNSVGAGYTEDHGLRRKEERRV